MKTIYVSGGHSAIVGKGRDNGAAGNGFIEGVEADKFRDLVYNELKNIGVSVITDSDDTILADTIKTFKQTANSESILVEFHFNAASAAATGAETLIPDAPTELEKTLAKKINDSIANTLGIKNRGVKTEGESARGRLGFMRLAGTNILPEICFISNKIDMEKFQKNKVQLAKNIAQVLAAETKPTKEYTVVKGDTLTKIAVKHNTTIQKLKKDNNLSSDVIQIGQKLKV